MVGEGENLLIYDHPPPCSNDLLVDLFAVPSIITYRIYYVNYNIPKIMNFLNFLFLD